MATKTTSSIFRIYEPHELGGDGYPEVWHRGLMAVDHGDGPEWEVLQGNLADIGVTVGGVKDAVRHQADHRCVRCGHPYVVGESGEWEPANRNRDAQLQAELGVVFYGGEEQPPKGIRNRAIHWSGCDDQCTHDGPARARVSPQRPWEISIEATADDISLAIRQHNEVQSAWRILTVHHLNERKHDLRWHNLVALCQRCHLHIQKKVTMEQIWPLEHSPWFKPYAAAFYAYSYLGEELTRDETMDRLDDLLMLERAV